MLDEPMFSAVGAVVGELRTDSDVATLVGRDLANRVRVRGGEPVGAMQQGGGAYGGDARGPGDYQAFVVVSTLDETPHPSVPIFTGTYDIAAYGATFANAREVWGAVVKALHRVLGRIKTNGMWVYISLVDAGGEQDKDPDTGQPLMRGIVRLTASANAVA